jgi:hypothetical protein
VLPSLTVSATQRSIPRPQCQNPPESPLPPPLSWPNSYSSIKTQLGSPPPGSLCLTPAIMCPHPRTVFSLVFSFLQTRSPFHIVGAPRLSPKQAPWLSLIIACALIIVRLIPSSLGTLLPHFRVIVSLVGPFPTLPIEVAMYTFVCLQQLCEAGFVTPLLQRRGTWLREVK